MDSFSVLYSGGLDSCAVPLIIGKHTKGGIHLLTYKHKYGTFFNNWSKKHTPDLQRVLGMRVEHHLIDLTKVWNEVGAKHMVKDALQYKGHWVCCLGCQESMATHTIIYNLERGITNTLICSSVGGEYAVMSMPVTRDKNAEFYARYGIRYNAPLLDLGIGKPEERQVLAEHGIQPGWGARRNRELATLRARLSAQPRHHLRLPHHLPTGPCCGIPRCQVQDHGSHCAPSAHRTRPRSGSAH